MELIDPEERCVYCFSQEIGEEKKICSQCLQSPPLWHRITSAVDYQGPAVSLIKALKYGGQPYLAKGIASYMVAQLIRMKWPMPDLIVPVPIPLTRWFQRGYNQSQLLAEEIGAMIGRPVHQSIKRRCGDFSQSSLSGKQRRGLSPESFYLKDQPGIEDKVILLVDDVMTTGSTLRCCSDVLSLGCPEKIYVLTVCRAIQ